MTYITPRSRRSVSSQRNLGIVTHDPRQQDTLTPSDLAEALQRRERRALEIVYDRYSAALFGVIVRIVDVQEMAEDVLQEVFVKIWVNSAAYDPTKGSFFTWILNIARNAALDKVKSREYKDLRRIRSIDSVVDEADGRLSQPDTSDHIGLRELLNELKPEQRELVELVYFQGYTQSEAARELNIPLGTVKTRLRAAINIFRALISAKSGP